MRPFNAFLFQKQAIFMCAGLLLLPVTARAETAAPTSTVEGHVVSIQGHKISVAIPHEYTVGGEGAQKKIDSLSVGDAVRLGVSDDNEAQAANLQTINKVQSVSTVHRLVAGFIAFVLIFLVASLAASSPTRKTLSFANPLSYCVGLDNRISNSQTQLFLWSVTALTVYLTTVFLRASTSSWGLIGGVDIPTNLLAFSGLSALTFGGARAITVSKKNAAAAANAATAPATTGAAPAATGAAPPPATATTPAATEAAAVASKTDQTIKSPEGKTANITQLFNNDHDRLDLGDTQMIVITIIAIVIYFFQGFNFLGSIELAPHVTLPDVDTYLLASFGIGQGAYLAKKAGSNLGDG